MAPRPSWRLAAVVLVALVGLSALATLLDDDDDGDGAGDDRAGATEAFLEAWDRSRRATFRSVSEFRRVSASTGAELTDRIVVAQRPPDRLSVDGDGASGLVDGRRLACTYREQRLHCEDAAAQVTLEEETRRQLDTLTDYVTGDDRLYTVEALGTEPVVGDCYGLTLARNLFAPPLGEAARYCFDPATGAPTFTRIERVEADDETRVVSLSDEVDDADLDPTTALRDP
jgi:hypothetical protein